MDYITIGIIAFILSVVFSIGGVGSAIAIVPTMTWLGIPLMIAKPTGLFINTLSMLSATAKNIRHGKLDHRFGLPILLTATVFAPLGAYSGKLIPKEYVLWVFIAFLLYSGTMMVFFKPRPRNGAGNHVVEGSLIGGLAGFLGGLLGSWRRRNNQPDPHNARLRAQEGGSNNRPCCLLLVAERVHHLLGYGCPRLEAPWGCFRLGDSWRMDRDSPHALQDELGAGEEGNRCDLVSNSSEDGFQGSLILHSTFRRYPIFL